jgi:hypothetical protein
MPVDDKRELIMQRLHDICEDVDNIVTVVRNRGLMSNEQRPAVVILDGDELGSIFGPSQSKADFMPSVNTMKPEIYYLAKEARVKNEQIGTLLNTARLAICSAIADDAELKTLLGPNGGIHYNGCVTDLKSGSALTGEMRLDFWFKYVFNPQA